MPRIPSEQLERLKKEIPLADLVRAKGIQLERHGGDLRGLCPFHNDTEPSLIISPSKNLWHCLGACDRGGSVVDWVMKCEGVSFRYAVELLLKDSSSLAASKAKGEVRHNTTRVLPPVIDRDGEDSTVMQQVAGFYHTTLKQSSDAQDYLRKRGLNDPELVEHFKLGYANRTLAYRLPASNRRAGAVMRSQLQNLGILRDTGHEHLNGSLVVPIFNAAGEVVQMYGRKVLSKLRKGTPQHLYLPGPHRGVFNAPGIANSSEVIVCESLLDALTFWRWGFRNVTTAFGVNGFTDELEHALVEAGTQRVLIAYDRDEAGDRAAEKLSARLNGIGISTARVVFPKGMDANEYALKLQPAAKSLQLALRQAQWMGGTDEPKVAVQPISLAAPSTEVADATEAAVTTDTANAGTASNDVLPPAELVPSPKPPPPAAPSAEDIEADVREHEVMITLGDRRWRIRGLHDNTGYSSLKVNLLCSRSDAFHVDTLEMYSARHRRSFVAQAATELGVDVRVLNRDMAKVLLKLEALQQAHIESLLETEPATEPMSDDERAAALELLRDPKLIERILNDMGRCGVVGEQENKLLGYLAAVSRKLDDPLAVVIQSSSAAGKSSLMDAVLAMIPAEDRVQYSAMTGQSLFYMGETDLKHKVLAIVEEHGAQRATYALKLLQSEGVLTIASTGKDPVTGRLVTQEYRVEGPVMIFLTTTAIEIDEELLNRCLVLTVNESRDQTRAIHAEQRAAETLEGFVRKRERDAVRQLHRNAQRLLEPALVFNPYAESLTFMDERTRARRDHKKYLVLIRTIALLHQHQRPVKEEVHEGHAMRYIEVTPEDIALANRLAEHALRRSLDELPPQTRRMLEAIETLVTEQCAVQGIERDVYRFTRRTLREQTGWSLTQVRLHLERLAELEYVAVHRGGRGQGYVYELVGSAGGPAAVELIDVGALDMKVRRATCRGMTGGGGRPPANLNVNGANGNSESWRGGGASTSRDELNDVVVPYLMSAGPRG